MPKIFIRWKISNE